MKKKKTRKVDRACFIIGPLLNSTLLLNDPRNESAARPAIEPEVAGEGIISEHQRNRFPDEIRLKVRETAVRNEGI